MESRTRYFKLHNELEYHSYSEKRSMQNVSTVSDEIKWELQRMDDMVKSLENLENQFETNKNTKHRRKPDRNKSHSKRSESPWRKENKGCEMERPVVKGRTGIPVPNGRSGRSQASGNVKVIQPEKQEHSQSHSKNEGDFCTESVTAKTAVRMFGGEARIRKLPTPISDKLPDFDQTGSNSKLSQEGNNNETFLQTNIDEDFELEFDSSSSEFMDYPIRGTISPLTDNVRNKNMNGAVDELSFVFGRPASPVSDTGLQRCMSPPYHDRRAMSSASGDTGIKRCMSPPYRERRVMSPATDATPAKRPNGMYTKPPIYPNHGVRREKFSNSVYEKALSCSPPTNEGKFLNGGICCQHCNNCLLDFKRQALRLMYPDGNVIPGGKQPNKSTEEIETKLQVPENSQKFLKNDRCDVCDTHILHLKKEAVAMVQAIQQAQTESAVSTNIQALVGSCNFRPQHRTVSNSNHPRYLRQNKNTGSPSSYVHSSVPIAVQAQAYLEWNSPKKVHASRVGAGQGDNRVSEMMNIDPSVGQPVGQPVGYPVGHPAVYDGQYNMQYVGPSVGQYSHPATHYAIPGPNYYTQVNSHQYVNHSVPPPQHQPPPPPTLSRVSSPSSQSPTSTSVTASFFARAAQKLSKKKKRHQPPEPEPPPFPTKFYEIIRISPPPAPPCLLRVSGRLQNPGVGKVKVMIKICPSTHHGEQGTTFLGIDPRKKQVTVYDPSTVGYSTSAHRRTSATAPKMFAFDAVFSPDDSQTEICASSLTDIVQGVVNGADGCLFTYGYSKQGKSFTMLGTDQSTHTLGMIPCAITWLFKHINEQKEKTGARFSVRVSAVEVTGKQECLKDLLADVSQGTESGIGTAPGVYLREDPISGTQLENQSELRAPTAERAAYYLDAALAARTQLDEEDIRSSHLLFTLHVYQYRIEKANQAGLPGVAGGRSRLHLIDLGSSSKSKDPDNVSLSLSALGNVIMALLNGQRHVPHRDSKIAQLLRDSLGNISCRTCMIAHVSSSVQHHNESLQVIQLAARIHRMKRRKTKFSSTSSDDSSTDDGRLRTRPFRGFRMGTLREDMVYSSSHSDPDYTSSSEQSCDTVIYIGANGQSLSDREFTDNEGPPRSVPRTNPRLPRRPSGSRSSGDEGSTSDSGRSYVSNSRYGRTHSASFTRMSPLRMGTPVREISNVPEHANSPPASVASAQLPQKMNLRTHPAVASFKQEEPKAIARIEKVPRTPVTVSAKSSNPQQQIKGEQWVDGPGAAIYPENKVKNEMWIDGPQAFVKKVETPKKTDANKHLFNPKMNAEEQWVDGPKEMIASENVHREGHYATKAAVHSSCRTDKRGHSRDHSNESKSSPSHTSKHTSKSKHVHEQKDRPDSTVSVDSSASITAQAADSRPTSIHSENEQTMKIEEGAQIVKPFVRDWVEKHSAINDQVDKDPNIGFIVDAENKVIGSLEPASTYKRSKPEPRKKISSSTPKHSPRHSPRNSPALARKGKTEQTQKLQKSQLPAASSPSHRVAEWLRTVSTEQDMTARKQQNDQSVKGNELENTSTRDISACSSVQMETTAESDSLLDTSLDTHNETNYSGDGRPDEMAEYNIADISFDSSVDTAEISNGQPQLNRDSIYEQTLDETLEHSGSKCGNDIPDDETFSSVSCNKENELSDGEDENEQIQENEPLLSKSETFPHSTTVESIKTLVAETVAPSYCDNCLNEKKDSEILSEYDNDMCQINRPLLRKPDGASNPNLSMNELELGGKFDNCFVRGEYIINNVHTIASHTKVEYDSSVTKLHPTSKCTTLPKCLDSYKNSDCLEKDLHGAKKPCTKSKPPLPQKSSSKLHSSSPSRQSPPKNSFNKDISASPKSNCSISSKSSSIPVSSHSSRSKDKSSRLPSTSSLSSSPLQSTSMGSPCSTSTLRSMSSKSSKSQSPSSSRLPMFANGRNGQSKDSKSKKKDKENKSNKLSNGRISELNRTSGSRTDSDSGNDSGIVTNEKRLLSPYSTVTKPRTPSHSSSGHGSDNSSNISAELRLQLGFKSDKIHGGTSSGYESMLRDSEATASSSGHEESNSESSSEKKKGSKRKRSSTRRSRSAPARSSESPENRKQSPSTSRKTTSPSPKAWIDTRQIQKIKEEPFEIKLYDVVDVERLGRRRTDESELEQCKEKLKELLSQQQQSGIAKPDSPETKDQIVVERSGWSFDCRFLMCFSCKSRSKKTDV